MSRTHFDCVQVTSGSPTAQLTSNPGVLGSVVAKLTGSWTLYDAVGATTNPILSPPGESDDTVRQFDLDVEFENGLYLVTTNGEPFITVTWTE